MNIETRPISEISRRATCILFKEMSVVDTIRFLNQFSVGRGDYTKERENWLGEITLNDAVSQIKAGKNKTQQVT
jgi:predicted transcriptional regulator